MILCDRQIREYCLNQQMIVPFDPELLNSQSYDVQIGTHCQLLASSGWQEIDLSEKTEENPFWFQPLARVLVASFQVFNLPDNVCGIFKLKSSRAREFYDHLNSGWLDGGWHGSNLTMGLKNEAYDKLPLYLGLRIGQIIFMESEMPEKSYRGKGRYNNDQGAVRSKG